jgi:hypothetical protein
VPKARKGPDFVVRRYEPLRIPEPRELFFTEVRLAPTPPRAPLTGISRLRAVVRVTTLGIRCLPKDPPAPPPAPAPPESSSEEDPQEGDTGGACGPAQPLGGLAAVRLDLPSRSPPSAPREPRPRRSLGDPRLPLPFTTNSRYFKQAQIENQRLKAQEVHNKLLFFLP